MTAAYFMITGEALTRHARALALEGEPGKASWAFGCDWRVLYGGAEDE